MMATLSCAINLRSLLVFVVIAATSAFADGGTWHFEYTGVRGLGSGRDRITSFEYDSVGRKTKQTAPAPLSYVEQWTYDANGNQISYTNGRNHTWAYTVDALNRRTAITAPDVGSGNRTESYSFDAEGNRLSTTDRLGIVETYTFDAENRQLTRTRDGELKFTRVFDVQGNLTSETDARGNATTHTFDAANRRTQTTRPEGVIEAFTYTADNDIATSKDGLNRITTHTFDGRRRLTSTTNPANEVTRFSYDLADRQRSKRLPLNSEGQEWRYAFDGAGRLLSVTNPQAQVTEYRYDLAGNRTLEKNARGHDTLLEYDSLNRLTARVVPGGARWQWTHDGAGNVVEARKPDGTVIAHTFDARNRRTESALQSSPTSGHWRRTTWTYDANDKITRETITRHDSTPDYVTERGYDRQERLTREANGHGQVLVSTFDRGGNRTSLIDAQGETTSYQYDALNRLKQSSAPGIGTTTYHYDTASQLIRKEGQGSYEAAFAHDDAGRIDTIAHRIGSTPLLELDYEFDDNGNRTQQVLRSGSETETTNYTFDDSDRLTAFEIGDTRTSYNLDAVGNRTLEQVRVAGAITRETAYTFDARDQVTTETPAVPTGPPIAYTHDANGNLTRRGPAASPLATYLYDSRDRLIRLTTGAQAPIESHYDEQDRRISRSDGATGSRYQWLGNHLIEELNSTNNRLTRYHRGVGLIGTTGQTSNPEPRQYALDALGTPLALIRTDGAIAGRTKFDPWGLATAQSGEQSKLGHTGYQREVDDSYQAIARWYRPGIGRFQSMDPIDGDPTIPATLNEYLAFNGNPTIYVDPDGRASAPACASTPAGCYSKNEMLGWQLAGAGNDIATALRQAQSAPAFEPAQYVSTSLSVGPPGTGPRTGLDASAARARSREYEREENRAELVDRAGNIIGLAPFWENDSGVNPRQKVNPLNDQPMSASEWNTAVLDAAALTTAGLEMAAGTKLINRQTAVVEGRTPVVLTEKANGTTGGRLADDLLECCARCFGAGTLVMTADGLRPIEQIKVGEKVIARDEASGETGPREVKHVIVRSDREVFDLTFADEAGNEEPIAVTADHRFHTAKRGWVVSAELEIGEAIQSLDGRKLVLKSSSQQSRKAPTFNLSVDDDPNYFVGESGLWVHNCTPCGGGGKSSKPPKGTPEGDAWRYERYVAKGGSKSFDDWYRVSRGGRSGGDNHRQIQQGLSQLDELDLDTEVPFGGRYADAAGPGEIHQIGGLNKRGDPIKREREAISEILKSERYSGETIYFWDKNNPASPPIENPQLKPNWGSLDDNDG